MFPLLSVNRLDHDHAGLASTLVNDVFGMHALNHELLVTTYPPYNFWMI